MSRPKLYTYLLIGLLGLILLTSTLIVRRGIAQTSVIPVDVAINLALSYAKDDGRVGGLVDQPTEMYGQVMTYGEAVQYIFARSIDPNDGIVKMRDNPVWLIILHGEFVQHVPPAPDIPAKDVVHSQMAVIIDGNTGEIIERVLISPQMRLPVTSLPVLVQPSGPVPPAPTRRPISTAIPFPTATPIRQ